jgi:hypothetical protein
MTEIVPDPWLENLHEMGYPGDDFLELLDLDDPVSPYLDNPASSSSSSENSSCLTISSGECFDSLALLQDLEPENSQKDAGCKFSVSASHRPNEVVMLPATSGLSTFLCSPLLHIHCCYKLLLLLLSSFLKTYISF